MDVLPAALVTWGTPILVTLLITALIFWIVNKSFANRPQSRLYRQLAYVSLFIVSQIVLVIALPLNESTESHLLTLFGYVLTGVIAFSSTSFVSNAMAGMMLKAMGNFHAGDFIRVNDQFGRVTARTLLHTEIQSEDRDTVTLPNLYVISNPVHVVDQSGTLISANLAIGYDVNRRRVRELLLEAAEATGLTDAFVHVIDIGDFAVRYKITGFLQDVSKIVSANSDLKANVLDTFHTANVEIMTPTVMSQRPLPANAPVIPRQELAPELESDAGKAERMMFDKAEIAARIQRFRDQIAQLKQEIADLQKDGEQANTLEITWRQHQLEALQDIVDRFDADDA